MYLKSLELHGFKSFPEKTVLRFDHGSTIIVGPNGSGKSNITDAMRWVLGELSSKTIRGSKMEDVIFIGADGYRQMNFAEVSVTFDDSAKPKRLNSEYDEVTVTRRYYRSGESEYFINRKSVRLRDIYELFMNTGIGRDGYSIIGQGKIAEIISKKSEERRGIFEETAGISKYRYRKHESERKLAETENNMVRISDILSELETRVGPMERAAQKARKYIEFFDAKKEADISLWLYDMVKMREEVEKLESECRISAHELEIAEDTVSQLESQSEKLFNASQENKQAQMSLYSDIKALREKIHETENRYKIIENNIAHSKINAENELEAVRKTDESVSAEMEELKRLNALFSDIGKKLEDIRSDIKRSREAHTALVADKEKKEKLISDSFEELKRYENAKAEAEIRLNVLVNMLTEHEARSVSIVGDIEKYEKEISEFDARAEEISETVGEYKASVEAADKEIFTLDREINSKSDKIEHLRIELGRINSDKSALDSRIAALSRMLEHFDGYNNSVKYVMGASSRGDLAGIHGPVSHLIHVPDAYTVAVETALGAAIQGIVVENEESAKSAIRVLKNASAGRATFYPITSVKGRARSRELEEVSSRSGFVGYANELISADEKYSGITASLLGSIAVFENIDAASSAAKSTGWKIRAVTLDGQQINAGGSFTGGSARRDSGILTRQTQIDKLKSEAKELEEKASAAESKRSKAAAELEKLRSERKMLEEKIKIIETMIRTESVEGEEIQAKRSVTAGLVAQLREDFEKLRNEKDDGSGKNDDLTAQIASLEEKISEMNALRAGYDVERHDAESAIAESSEKINALLISEAAEQRDLENTEALIAASEERISALEEEKTGHEEKISAINLAAEENSKLILTLKTEVESGNEALEAKERERLSLEEGGMDFEKKINDLRLRIRDLTSKKELQLAAHSKSENKLQLLKSDIEKMSGRIYDEYELTHTDAANLGYPEVTKENRAEIQSRLNELKSSIRALGSVNVDAIEEYAELKSRYDYVTAQMNDLTASKEELDSVISSIEEEMERMFRDAFTKINKNFGEVFRELFGGGHAELTLTDPDDILNCGIEISAAPPGKMIKNLSLLSGGEQAFIAIALMFALIKVNPSPFCIFDEIEAALDEVNVNRVANYISRFSKDIQIIMITHRRGTMEIADTLYGVTMPRHGVSKVFTLDVGAVSKQQFIEEHLGNN